MSSVRVFQQRLAHHSNIYRFLHLLDSDKVFLFQISLKCDLKWIQLLNSSQWRDRPYKLQFHPSSSLSGFKPTTFNLSGKIRPTLHTAEQRVHSVCKEKKPNPNPYTCLSRIDSPQQPTSEESKVCSHGFWSRWGLFGRLQIVSVTSFSITDESDIKSAESEWSCGGWQFLWSTSWCLFLKVRPLKLLTPGLD